jgi:hypothetical protein
MTPPIFHVPRFRSLAGIAIALSAATFSTAALTPLPSGHVTDADVIGLLKTGYRAEGVNFGKEWSTRIPTPGDENGEAVDASRTICADSGRESYGPRMIAVCTSYSEAGHVTPGSVDLWLLLDPRGDRAARVGASKRDIDSGSFGTPGDVSFFAIGPARTAFALDSGYANMGWSSNTRTLYFAESDRFESLLTYGTSLDNGGVCDPNEDATCKKKMISVECTLQAVTTKVERGFYALRIDVKGERGGKPVNVRIPIPFADGVYTLPQERLAREGCDQGF